MIFWRPELSGGATQKIGCDRKNFKQKSGVDSQHERGFQ